MHLNQPLETQPKIEIHARELTKGEMSEYLRKLGRKGGKATAKKLTPEQRKESARKAAEARWAKAVGTNAPSKQQRDRNIG